MKSFMDWRLNNVPFFCTCICPIEWSEGFVSLEKDCVLREDYEGAKATMDSIKEFRSKISH